MRGAVVGRAVDAALRAHHRLVAVGIAVGRLGDVGRRQKGGRIAYSYHRRGRLQIDWSGKNGSRAVVDHLPLHRYPDRGVCSIARTCPAEELPSPRCHSVWERPRRLSLSPLSHAAHAGNDTPSRRSSSRRRNRQCRLTAARSTRVPRRARRPHQRQNARQPRLMTRDQFRDGGG